MHHSPLPHDEVTTENGIPLTTIPRTLLDLAPVLPPSQVERALNEAEIRQRTDPLSLLDLIDRHRHRPGIRVIRALLGDLRSGGTVTRSELETRFRQFLRSYGLPPPAVNCSLLGFECDCVWQAQRLIVELDGRAVHATAAAFERDRERDRILSAPGWRVVRITWRQLHEQPERVAVDLRKLVPG
jgi:very-short-patch-repair endonuclease